MQVIFWIRVLIYIIWLIGYPVYKKIKKESIWIGTLYSLVVCILALVVNIINSLRFLLVP